MALSRSAVLAHSSNLPTKEVHVPELASGGDDVLIVRAMTVREYEVNQARAARINPEKEDPHSAASIVVRCVLDADGDRLFTDADIPLISELPLGPVNKLVAAIFELCGLGDDADADTAKAQGVADAEGKSEPTPSGDSSSA